MNARREFLSQVGALATLGTFDASELAVAAQPPSGKWDLLWVDALSTANYRVVFNAEDIAYGAAIDYAETFLDHFREAQGTTDAQTRPVIVFRRLGTPMALNDVMWERYAVGEDSKIADPRTHKPATRNVYQKQLDTLRERGLISLVCNIALGNWSARAAKRTDKKVADVLVEARANLIPGAVVVPSGIFALIRAQNAGCAYMPGT